MSNGNSQTDGTSGDDLRDISDDLRNIYDSARLDLVGNVSHNPDTISRDVAYIKQLERLFPDYQGKNVYNTKYRIINNEAGELDKVATRLLTIRAQNEPELREKIKDEDNYKKAYNQIKATIKRNLLEGSVTGESIANTIVNRQLELFNRPNTTQASLSYTNNNPLNIMSDAISDDLSKVLSENGIKYTASEHQTEDGILAKFPSYEQGLKAAGVAIVSRHGDSTVDQMMRTWSNDQYNGSILNDDELASKKVKDLQQSQLAKVMRRMQNQEGWDEGAALTTKIPVEEYKEYISENPERYEEFGVVDSEGNLIFENLDDENRSLESIVSANDDLHKKLLEDRYRDFEEALNNENNAPTEFQGIPSFKAQAFAVYDRFGSEGLTQFINILQQDEMKETSPQRLRQAIEWYRENNVGRVRQRFIGKGKNRISFTPPQSTLDLVAKVPADANDFAAIKYKFDKKNREFVKKPDEDLVDELMKKYTAIPVESISEIQASRGSITGAGTAVWNALTNLDFFTSDSVEEYQEGIKEDLKNYEKSGLVFTKGYDVFLENVFNHHRENESLDSLVRTLQANGETAGEGRWVVSYENADRMTKIAADALNQSMEYSSLVYPDGNGNIVLDLNRRERVSNEVNRLAMENASKIGAFEWKANEEENRWEKTFDSGPLDDTINILNTLNFGSLQMLDRHFIGPTMQHTASAFRTLADQTNFQAIERTADDVARFLDWNAESDLVEGVNSVQISNPFSTELGTDLSFVENGGWLTKTVGKVTPVGQVVGSILLKGKAAGGGLKSLANYASKVTKTSKAMSALGASKYLKGSKFKAIMDRWDDAQKARKVWTYGGAFYLGDLIEEATMPKNQTMLNFGTKIYDDAMQQYAGLDTNANQDYRAANGIVRTGLDMLTSFGFSSLFDNLLVGPAKYTKDKWRIWRGKKVPTLEIDAETGKPVFRDLDTPQWRNDMTEFYHGLTKDMDKWMIEDAETALRRDLFATAEKNIGRENLTESVRNVVKDMNELIDDDLIKNVEETVRHYNKMFGGKLNEEEIAKITSTRYDQFMNQMADGFYALLSKAHRDGSDSVPLKVADILENGAVTIREMEDDAGFRLMNLEDANAMTNRVPFRTTKKIKDSYVVKDIKENSWAVELGQRIRNRVKDKGVKSIINQESNFRGGLDEETEEQLRSVWSYLYGRKVSTEPEDSYIVGLGSTKGFRAINESGETIDNISLTNFDEVADDIKQYIEERNGVRKEEKFTDTLEETAEQPDKYDSDLLAKETSLKKHIQKFADELNKDIPNAQKESIERNIIRLREQLEDVQNRMKDNEGGLEELDEAIDVDKSQRLKNILEQNLQSELGQKIFSNIQSFSKAYNDVVNVHASDKGWKNMYESTSRNKYGYNEVNQEFLANTRDTGRKSIGMVEKAARNIGVDDERTIDLVRTTKSGREKRVIGKKNVAPVREWDADEAANGIPKGVAVKRTNADGKEMFFLSNKPTNIEPSKWVKTQVGLRLNPDWDMISKNRTLDNDDNIQLYIRETIDEKPMYRLPEEGETGDVVLNIQNPTKADGYLDETEIWSRDIDAYVRDARGKKYFEPIREEDQAIRPEDILTERKREGVRALKSGVKNGKETILENVRIAGFGSSVARILGGHVAGRIVDYTFGDDEDTALGGQIGAALGLALGLKPIKNAFTNVSYTTSKKTADSFERLYKWAKENQVNDTVKKYQNIYDPAGDLRLKSYRDWSDKFFGAIESAALFGRDISESVRKNRHVQSSFSMLEELRGLGSSVTDLKKLLLTVGHTPNEIESNLSISINKRLRQAAQRAGDDSPIKQYAEGGTPYEDFRDHMIRWSNDYIDEFELDQVALGGRRVRTDRMSEQEKMEFFGQEFWRVMNSNARRLDNGRYHRTPTPTTNHIYLRAKNVNQLEQADKFLIDDPFWGEVAPTMRDWFEDIKGEWQRILGQEINKTKGRVDPMYSDLANKLVRSDLSVSDFKQTLSEDEIKSFSKAVGKGANKDAAFNRLVELTKRQDKFTEIGREYLPQVWSSNKFNREMTRFINDYIDQTKGATRKEAKQAFLRKAYKDWTDLNNGKPRVLQHYDLNDEQVKTREFKSPQAAKHELRQIITSSAHLSGNEQDELLRTSIMDDFVKEIQKEVRVDEGQYETVTKYVLEEPEVIKANYDVFADPNNKAYEDFFDIISSGALVKNSNYLEKPRKFVLPDYMAEDNMQNIIYKYKTDVGRKLHFAREGVFMEDDMSRQFLGKIKLGLQEKYDAKTARKYLDRIKDIYRQQTGIIHELKQFEDAQARANYMQDKIKKSQLVSTIRNVIGMGYVYGIGYYDIFQHAIMSPLLTSQGSWAKAMKVINATGAADRINDAGRTLQYSNQKLQTFLPEIDELTYGDTASKYGAAYKKTQNWLNWAGDFSITRAIGDKTGWWDVDNFGKYRLFVDGFYGVNQTATSINGLAHLVEAEELGKLWKQLKESDQTTIRKGMKTYTERDIREGLEKVGIFADEIDDFVAKTDEVNQFIDYIEKGENRGLTVDDLSNSQHNYIRRILETATDSYHGRNKMFRPESWNTQLGRLLGQYSFYPMNFSLQTTQRRIRQPIQRWNDKFGHVVDNKKIPALKLYMDLNQGKKGLERAKSYMKGSEEEINQALNEFPLDAYTTIFKLLPAAGLTFAMTMTTDAIQDVTWMLTAEAGAMLTGEDADYEAFKRSKENYVLNPWAAEDDQRSLHDVIDDPEWLDFLKVAGYFGSIFADMGTFGKYGNAVFRDSRFEGNSVVELTPVGRDLEIAYDIGQKGMSSFWQKGGEDFGETMGKGLYDFVTPKIPVLGSQSMTRSGVKDAVFNKPKNNNFNGGGIRFESRDRIGNRQSFGNRGMRFENR